MSSNPLRNRWQHLPETAVRRLQVDQLRRYLREVVLPFSAHYRELFEYPNVVRAMVNTFGIGVIGGAIAVVGYTAIALSIHRWQSPWTRLVDYLVLVPRAMPGLVAGLAMLWVFLFVKPLTPLKETLVSVWLAYTIVWMAYGMRLVSGTLLQVGPELEEASDVHQIPLQRNQLPDVYPEDSAKG